MKIFIGCSASNNISDEYYQYCSKLLEEIFNKENSLIFGACDSGLMGLTYEIAKRHKKNVIGVCPLQYKDDFKCLDCYEEIVTDNISKRTEEAIINSDALIFLPGGIGTVYELLAAIEFKRCHEFDKPIVIYNCNGYFDKLLEFLEQLYEEKFISIDTKSNYYVSSAVSDILNYIYNYFS